MGPLSLRRRAVALISVLLIGILLFVLTLTFLTKQRLEHQSISFQLQEARARALAQAGLEEVLVKLDKDYNFPPQAGPGQSLFAYTERLKGSDGILHGQYSVKIDQRFRPLPQQILLVEVSGEVGQDSETQRRATLLAFIDVNPDHATHFQVIQLEWRCGGL